MKIKAILTDVEGTTSSVSFVREVLFPYSRKHLADFVRENPLLVDSYLQMLMQETGAQDLQNCIEVLLGWIDQDKKAFPLKAIQGLIWKRGYQNGELKGHVYPEVRASLSNWKSLGLSLYVFSSGSVEAQKLIFGYSTAGDLTHLFSGYFDTGIGGKLQKESYAKISSKIRIKPNEILFLSDHEGELLAAKQAQMQVLGLCRGHHKIEGFDSVASFDQIPMPFVKP